MNGVSMTMRCDDLKGLVRHFSLVSECDVLGDGTLRVATPFKYPDGSFIDLFLQQDVSLTEDKDGVFRGFILSDMSQTAAFLLNLHIDLAATKKRRQIVAEICRSLRVEHERGQFGVKLELGELECLPDAMVRVAQACVRAADVSFSQRFPMSTPFRDEVEEFIDGNELSYEPDISVPSRFGRDVPIDFRVRGRYSLTLVKTLSTSNATTAHQVLNEIFTCWYDLGPHLGTSQYVTVIDDRTQSARPADLTRLTELSNLVGFPSQHDLLKNLLAA